jgi:hypothetical protein
MVNTFLPYGNFEKVARTLDAKRLGKQRVEAKQILNILMKKTKSNAWRHHPVVLMWRGYIQALKHYHNVMIDEWIKRGYYNTMKKFRIILPINMPWFLKCKPLLLSHQASLLRKYPEYYSKYFKVRPDYIKRSYLWITKLNDEQLQRLKMHKKIKIADYTLEYVKI